MPTQIKNKNIKSSHQRIAQAVWLCLILSLSSMVSASDDIETTTAIDHDNHLMSDISLPPLNDMALDSAHAKGCDWEAPMSQNLAVIIWDETDKIRRTGSGNLMTSNVTIINKR